MSPISTAVGSGQWADCGQWGHWGADMGSRFSLPKKKKPNPRAEEPREHRTSFNGLFTRNRGSIRGAAPSSGCRRPKRFASLWGVCEGGDDDPEASEKSTRESAPFDRRATGIQDCPIARSPSIDSKVNNRQSGSTFLSCLVGSHSGSCFDPTYMTRKRKRLARCGVEPRSCATAPCRHRFGPQ